MEECLKYLEDLVARWALVFGKVCCPMPLVRVAGLDDFPAELAGVQRVGLVRAGVVLGNLLHCALDYHAAELARPRLVAAAAKQKRVNPSVVSSLYKSFELLCLF